MVGESYKNVLLIQIDALSFTEFEISEFEIARVDCSLLSYFRNAIYLSNLHTLEPVLLYKEAGTVDSLVIDSVRQRIYWTGTQLGDRDAGYLASLNLRGLDTYKRLLASRNRPKSLTLHPNGK